MTITTILKVVWENTEYRCEKTEDIHGDMYSMWVSINGEELTHSFALKLYEEQLAEQTKVALIKRLFTV